MTRNVWSSETFPDCVIKVEEVSRGFQNIIEWETWNHVKDTEFAKWFAPCKFISPSGSVLIMARTDVPRSSEFPDKLPIFLTDTKRTNYGVIGKRFVCHDYGTHLMFETGMTKRMRKVKWWDE